MAKIDKGKLLQMLARGKTQAKCAKHFGVTTSAVAQMKQRILAKRPNLPEVPLAPGATEETTTAIVKGGEINAAQQLKAINQKANCMLDELLGDEKILDQMCQAVESMLIYEGYPKKQKRYIR